VRFRATDFSATARPSANTAEVGTSSFDATPGFDVRLLEDERFTFSTGQTGSEHGRDAAFLSTITAKGHHVPASRHSRCLVEGHRGQLIRQPDCGLTDGDLDHEWMPRDDPKCVSGPCPGHHQHNHRDVYVRLRHPIRAGLVVVRGCIDVCKVQVKAPGRAFTTVARQAFGAPTDFLFAELHGRRVNAVRVQTETGGFFLRLREVSVFGHRA
jgi:hypothetical protein